MFPLRLRGESFALILEDDNSALLDLLRQHTAVIEIFGGKRKRLNSGIDVPAKGNDFLPVFKAVSGEYFRNQGDIDIAFGFGRSFGIRAE